MRTTIEIKMPRKEELYLTKTQIHRVCELYHEEENLWNIQSPHYFKREKKNAALERIKFSMNDEFEDLPNFTVDQLWTKLANLRSYYTKELKKVPDSKKSGAGTDDVYKSSWGHFDKLDTFLRTQVIPRKSQTNLDNASQANDQLDSDNGDDETMSQVSVNSDDRSVTPTPSSTPRRLTGKKRTLSGPETVLQEAASVLAQMKTRRVDPVPPTKPDDEDDIFGKHVASEMRKIMDKKSKGMARVKIQSILFEAQFNTQAPATTISQHHSSSTSRPMFHGDSQNYFMENTASSTNRAQFNTQAPETTVSQSNSRSTLRPLYHGDSQNYFIENATSSTNKSYFRL